MPAVIESERISIRRLELPGRHKLLVMGVHLPSKVNVSDDSQVFESVYLARAAWAGLRRLRSCLVAVAQVPLS